MRNQKPVIAFISESSHLDRHAWSGTVHYTWRALAQAGFEVIPLGPARPGTVRMLLGALNKLSLLFTGLRIDYRHSKAYSKAFGKIFSEKLREISCDLVVVCGTTECGAYLQTDKPVVYVLDRTIQGALNYHAILSRLWKTSMEQSVFTDRKAMKEAAHLFFSSEWAAAHASMFYGIAREKMTVAAFGANLDELPIRDTALTPRDMTVCKLLLVGTHWTNKGADIAYRTAVRLNSSGIKATLTVVGCSPPEPINDPALTIIPFIDKNTPEGRTRLTALYLEHHFFILPTRFDCTPIVFCEASAHGLPILSADTGGVRGHVFEGGNGWLLPYDDTTGAGYAARIEEMFSDPVKYHQQCAEARQCYETRLNWNVWADIFRETVVREKLLPVQPE